MGDAARAAADPHGSEARNRSGPELVDEIQAGFADVAIAPTGASVLTVVATRP
jgi:hypothetical protein